MYTITDILTGTTVIENIDDRYIKETLSKFIAIDEEEHFPQHFWLSKDACFVPNEKGVTPSELKSMPDMPDFNPETYEFNPDDLEKKSGDIVLQTLLVYLHKNGVFIDSDGDGIIDPNEKGCYFGFEKVKGETEYQVTGNISGGDNIGLRVKGYDKNMLGDDFLGLAYTDAKGRYRIGFNREDFSSGKPAVLDGNPDLLLEVARLNRVTGEYEVVKKVDLPESDDASIKGDIRLTD